MGLVAHLLHEVERRRPRGQNDRTRVLPGDEKLLVALRQAAQRDVVDPHLVEHLHNSRQLRLAAIEDDEVGLAAEALVGHTLGAVAAAHHLLHREEVVRLVERRLDLEAAVLVLVRLAAREHDHRRDRIGPVNRRDVEALDAHGRRVERKRALELQQRIVHALVLVVRAHLVAHERVLRVRLRHVDKRRLLPLLRSCEAHFRPVRARELLGKPRLHRLFVLGQLPYDDLVGNGSGRVVVAQQEVMEKVLVGNVAPAVQDELVGVDDAPLADDEHVRARDRLLAEKAHDVGVQVMG